MTHFGFSAMMSFRGTLQDLRLFVAAYEEHSFTAAGVREHATQSGVSHHVRQLEQMLGVRLFIRERAGIVPTPAAATLYNRAVELLRQMDEAAQRVASFGQGYCGHFSVGIIAALTRRITGRTLLHFSREHPNVTVHLVELPSARLMQMVATGEIDFGIGTQMESSPAIETHQFLALSQVLVSSARLPTPRSGHRSPLKLVHPTMPSAQRAAMVAVLAAMGLHIDALMEVDSACTILDLVERSDWSTVVPALVFDGEVDRQFYHLQPLANPGLPFAISVVKKRSASLSLEAQAFVDVLRGLAEEASNAWDARLRGTTSLLTKSA